jgi:hypothetical protein
MHEYLYQKRTLLCNLFYGRAMAQAVGQRPFTAEPGFDPGQSMCDLWWTKWHWDRFFSPSTSVFLCQFHSTGAPLHGKTKKKLIVFITGLHNKPLDCGASVASAAGSSPKENLFY